MFSDILDFKWFFNKLSKQAGTKPKMTTENGVRTNTFLDIPEQ